MSESLKARTFAAFALAAALGACGGSSNPLDNPPAIENAPGSGGQKLSFAYFQRCVYPIFLAELPIQQGNVSSINTCAGSGCHDNTNGTGGAFRVVQNAATIDITDPANTADMIRAADMYKNFYSAQAAVVLGSPTQSRLLTKPLVQGVLHGGGIVFETPDDPNAQVIAFWISRPVPAGHDEFSPSANNLFTPADPNTGTCNTQ
jgi:predicted small lipoprotein YifL